MGRRQTEPTLVVEEAGGGDGGSREPMGSDLSPLPTYQLERVAFKGRNTQVPPLAEGYGYLIRSSLSSVRLDVRRLRTAIFKPPHRCSPGVQVQALARGRLGHRRGLDPEASPGVSSRLQCPQVLFWSGFSSKSSVCFLPIPVCRSLPLAAETLKLP
ncbi:unnamed protein product [Pleuronectes platessa]|uniref:Uncharacterized protein n=1 Tax=Pleuronectes platessa TaxID=8262 RepID=A0A9N7VF13_PLEPL|nr:unnamed protein product [Pleuronectes platessa]